MSEIKKIHETQTTNKNVNGENKIYSPIEDLQNIESGGPLNKEGLDLDSQPKGIKYIGYFIVGSVVITFLFVIFNLSHFF